MSERVSSPTPQARDVYERIPFGVWLCEPDGGLRYASDAFLELLGMTMEEAAGFGWTERVVEETKDSIERWKRCVAQECDWDDQHQIRDSSGVLRTMIARGHAVRDERGRIIEWVGVHLDITQRVTDEASALTRAVYEAKRGERDRMAHRLHDDLQQLLVAAKFQLDQVRRSLPVPQQKKLAHLHELINTCIDTSRNVARDNKPIDIERLGLTPALTQLADWVQDSLGLQLDLELAHIKLADKEAETVVYEAVRELLLNVAKHAGTDRATLRVKRVGDGLRVIVADEGDGFDPNAVHDGNGTTGLGLGAIRRRIEAHGGTMKVHSILGDGSEVIVDLPLP